MISLETMAGRTARGRGVVRRWVAALVLTAVPAGAQVAPQAASVLVITTQPAGAVSGVAFTTQPAVQMKDLGGGNVAQAGVVVTASVATGPGLLRGTLTATTDATGRATFTNLVIVDAGTHTLSFTATGLTGATSQSLVVTQPTPTALTSGTPVTSLTMPAGTARYFSIVVPSGVSKLVVSSAGGSGNLNLYVRAGQAPTFKSYACRSIVVGNADSCTFTGPQAGTYYVMAFAGSAVTGASLTATLPMITVRMRASTPVTIAPYAKISIPVVVDMSQAMGLNLASLTVDAAWDPARLSYFSASAGAFGTVTLNTGGGAAGSLRAGVFAATGATTTFTMATLVLKAGGAAGSFPVTVTVTGAGDETGQSVLSRVLVVPLRVCVAGGTYGDVNGDGVVDIIDAQQIARFVVGFSVTDPARLADAGDVTGDNAVNILDAQQIARKTVALAAAARIGKTIPAGPCP